MCDPECVCYVCVCVRVYKIESNFFLHRVVVYLSLGFPLVSFFKFVIIIPFPRTRRHEPLVARFYESSAIFDNFNNDRECSRDRICLR